MVLGLNITDRMDVVVWLEKEWVVGIGKLDDSFIPKPWIAERRGYSVLWVLMISKLIDLITEESHLSSVEGIYKTK